MKIGILTFHSQQNYGGLLQCWALKTFLQTLGHEVIIVDRWLEHDNRRLRRELLWKDPKRWLKFAIKSALGCGDWGRFVRTRRSISFVKGLGLSSYHFVNWNEAPSDLGIDALIVGSDQVWNCGAWGMPEAYLLEGVDGRVSFAIAYAASFGGKEISASRKALLSRGLSRFSQISCREQEGVSICQSLGYQAQHVADPTLLLSPAMWKEFSVKGKAGAYKRGLVCYFMSIDVKKAIPSLVAYAKKSGKIVDVITNDGYYRTVNGSVRNLGKERPSLVRICNEYGPVEFVQAFSNAECVITDSFHAVMFSSIFNCNIRFLRPSEEERMKMFSRILEFADEFVTGPLMQPSMDEAIMSIERAERVNFDCDKLSEWVQNSKTWLRDSLVR